MSMNFDEAIGRVWLAGRELGSGPAVAVPRLVPDYEECREKLLRIMAGAHAVTEPTDRDYDNAGRILLGVAIGLVMAEDEDAMRALEEISAEWLIERNR